jgi:hypothetical protein
MEVAGKKFVKLRNPWGRSEWTGPFSDGSKEWTPEWLQRMPELKHSFGDDGEFLMECKFLLGPVSHRTMLNPAFRQRFSQDVDGDCIYATLRSVMAAL